MEQIDITEQDRFYLQTVVTKKGTVMKQWIINDREHYGRTLVRIYHDEKVITQILNLLNKEFGYLD